MESTSSREPLGLDDCPDDVLFEISQHCSFHLCDLNNLSQVSKRLNTLCTPVLYRRVNISFHDDWTMEDQHPHVIVRRIYDQEPVVPKQQAFLRTLIERPEYGPLIRYFKWTLCWDGTDASYASNEVQVQNINYRIWEVFQLLTGVQDLDLGCINENECFAPFIHANPSALFCNAKCIRLYGDMHFTLVSAILHSGSPSRFESLAIDDLQDVGQYPNGIPIGADYDLEMLRESTNADGSRGLVFPGPMRGVLAPLTGCCTALHSLTLNKCGLEIHLNAKCDWPPELDATVYAEYAAFLVSVKPTLQEFYFEQGVQGLMVGQQCRDYRRIVQFMRPMDRNFLDHLYPVILAGGWKRLQRIELRGIGRWQDHMSLSDDMKLKIRGAVGPDVSCVIEEDARLMWWCVGMYGGLLYDEAKQFEVREE